MFRVFRTWAVSVITCNNPPDLAEAPHAGDAPAATAAPLRSSAALQTEHAWPAAGEQQTSEEPGPAAPVDKQLLQAAQT